MKMENHYLQPKYKSILVVKWFDQKEEADFDKIYSPVVELSSIKVILSLDALLNLELGQLFSLPFSMVI